MATLTAPEIQRYCEILSHRPFASFHNSAVFDAGTYQILDTIFDQIKQIMLREGTTGVQDLWFRAPRGSIKQFGNYQEWLLWSVNACIDALRAGTYNQFIETHLPVQHRIGTILRKDWWSIFPENRREFFSGHSQEDADLFTNYMEEADRQDIVAPPPKEMSANDYFRVCAGSSSPGCPRR